MLHYHHRLNVFKRPERKLVRWTAAPSFTVALTRGDGIAWQHPTLLERAARRTVSTFPMRRVGGLGVYNTHQPGNPSAQMQRFDADHDRMPVDEMTKCKPQLRRKLRVILSHHCSLRCSYLPACRRHFYGMWIIAGDMSEYVGSDEAPFCEVFNSRRSGRRCHLACEIVMVATAPR